MLIRITAPHFCAGAVLGKHPRFAPILHYMRYWSLGDIRHYCNRKRWALEIIDMT